MNETFNGLKESEMLPNVRNLVNTYSNGDYQKEPGKFLVSIQKEYVDTVGRLGIVDRLIRKASSKKRVSTVQQAMYQEVLDYITTDKDSNLNMFINLTIGRPTQDLKLVTASNAKVHKSAISELETIFKKGGIEAALSLLVLINRY